MRQVVQRPKDGAIRVLDVPPPALLPGTALVKVDCSLVSAGTERSKVDLARKSLLAKARARPDLVRQVLDRVRTDGLSDTALRVRSRLDSWDQLGYSASGRVVAVGRGFAGPAPGERIACAGGGLANHAEFVITSGLLSARVPDSVPPDSACFATVGAIALHGVRQAEATIADRVAVIGLGLVGQLTVQLLKAAGCHVLGIDLNERLCERARAVGADHAIVREQWSESSVQASSYDAVIITAAAPTADPVALAGQLARDRARVVVVGDVRIDVPRALYYAKELDIRLSRSYGPGRYDPVYESKGLDYPVGYVRWTEQRNLVAFVELLASGAVDPTALEPVRFTIDRAAEAYAALTESEDKSRPLAVVITYNDASEPSRPSQARSRRRAGSSASRPTVGVIGAGAFAQGTLLPELARAGLRLKTVASRSGVNAVTAKERFGFEECVDQADGVIEDPDVDMVVILTRHDSHAELACRALAEGKATYVEKPLGLTWDELASVEGALMDGEAPLFVGFNRRFAPKLQEALGYMPPGEPVTLSYRVNAGPRPAEHWLDDPEVGGGALLGEGCHFIDLVSHLTRSRCSVVTALGEAGGREPQAARRFAVTMRMENGSVGTIVYSTDGYAGYPKERLELMTTGQVVVVDNFRSGQVVGRSGRRTLKARQGKGIREHVDWIAGVLRGERQAPDPNSYLESSAATLAAVDSLRLGQAIAFHDMGGLHDACSLDHAILPKPDHRDSPPLTG